MSALKTYIKKIKKFFDVEDQTDQRKTIASELLIAFSQQCEEIRDEDTLDHVPTTIENITGQEHEVENLLNSLSEIRQTYMNKTAKLSVIMHKAKRESTTLQQNARFSHLNIDIEKEFEILNNIAPFTRINNCAAWKLPAFSLSGDGFVNVKIPGLYLFFNFSITDPDDAIRILTDPEKAIFDKDSGRFFHPHVNQDGRVCLGDGLGLTNRLWKEKKVVALTQLIIDILSNYNHESPYRRLAHWKQLKMFQCDNCGSDVSEKYVKFVNADQGTPGCPACTRIVDNKMVWRHDYVFSSYHHSWILKRDATKALTSSNQWDYFSNILSLSQFTSCPKCFSMVDKKCINTSGICSICVSKENLADNSNDTVIELAPQQKIKVPKIEAEGEWRTSDSLNIQF